MNDQEKIEVVIADWHKLNQLQRQKVIEHFRKTRKFKYTIKTLLDQKSQLVEECQSIHDEIIELQNQSKAKQSRACLISSILDFMYTSGDIDNDREQNPEPKNEKQDNKVVEKEPKVKSTPVPNQRARRLKKKMKLVKSIQEQMKPRTEAENLSERARINQEIKKYRGVDFENLKVLKVLVENQPNVPVLFESIKLCEKGVIRIRFDGSNQEQVKAFNRMVRILKYLEKCDATPRLLYFNANKPVIFLPYYGDPPEKHQMNRRLTIELRKLKRNWGVYMLKDGQVVSKIKPAKSMYFSKLDRLFIYDFTSSKWVVDRDREYPMCN